MLHAKLSVGAPIPDASPSARRIDHAFCLAADTQSLVMDLMDRVGALRQRVCEPVPVANKKDQEIESGPKTALGMLIASQIVTKEILAGIHGMLDEIERNV